MLYDNDKHAFVLTKADVRALLAFASRDATRPHLCQVHFEPAEGRATATDGHSLVRVANCGRDPRAGGFGVSVGDFRRASKLVTRKHDELRVRHESGKVRFTAVRGDDALLASAAARATDMAFPPLADSLFPPTDGAPAAPVIGVDMALLARVELVQKAAGAAGVRVRLSDDPLAPIRLDAGDDAGTVWTALVMPRMLP